MYIVLGLLAKVGLGIGIVLGIIVFIGIFAISPQDPGTQQVKPVTEIFTASP